MRHADGPGRRGRRRRRRSSCGTSSPPPCATCGRGRLGLRWVHVAAAGVDTLLFDELVDSEWWSPTPVACSTDRSPSSCWPRSWPRSRRPRQIRDQQRERLWRHEETRCLAGRGADRRRRRDRPGDGSAAAAAGCERPRRGPDCPERRPDFGEVLRATAWPTRSAGRPRRGCVAPLTEQTRGLRRRRGPRRHEADGTSGQRRPRPDRRRGRPVAALREGRIAAASLDVFAAEPLPTDSPLWIAAGGDHRAHVGRCRRVAYVTGTSVRRQCASLAGRAATSQRGRQASWFCHLGWCAGVGMSDLSLAPVVHLAKGFADGSISPVEATLAALDAIDRYRRRRSTRSYWSTTRARSPRRRRRSSGGARVVRSAPTTVCPRRSRTSC